MSQSWTVQPGGLSDADRERIQELAGKGWKSSRIARSISKNSGTVYWFMLRNGLIDRDSNRAQKPAKAYMRGGKWIHPYGREEDVFIEDLRVQDLSLKQIADLATKRFGKPRTAHGIMVRLTILSAGEATAA